MKGEIMIDAFNDFTERLAEWQPFINIGLGIIIFVLLLIFRKTIAKAVLSFAAKIFFIKKIYTKNS